MNPQETMDEQAPNNNQQQWMAALDVREFLIEDRIEKLKDFDLKVTEWAKRGGNDVMGGVQMGRKLGVKKTAEEVLAMPHVTLKSVEYSPSKMTCPSSVSIIEGYLVDDKGELDKLCVVATFVLPFESSSLTDSNGVVERL
jgi:hypothetical protein